MKNLLKVGKAGIMSLTILLAFNANMFALDWSGTQNFSSLIPITITDNITLTGNTIVQVTMGTTVNISGVISSSGNYTITKEGPGILRFTGNNTYTGNTIINAGQIIIGTSGTSTSGRIQGNIQINSVGLLTIYRSNNYTYSGVISGTGSISKYNSGTFILTGANTFNGNIAINAGIFYIGSGSATGSINANISVAEGATLRFSRSGTYTYSKIISGEGNVGSHGSGKVVLTGVNTYSGSTTVSSGTLQIGDGSTGSIANTSGVSLTTTNATLRFQPGATSTFSKVISGVGKVEYYAVSGRSLYFTADNTYDGTTTIESGNLYLGNGSLATGSVKGDIIITNGILFFNRASDYIYNGAISGSNNVIKESNFKLTANGNHTCTASFVLRYGTLEITKWAGEFSQNAGTTLEVKGELTITRDLYLNGGAINMNLSGSTPSRITVVTGTLSAGGTTTLNISAVGSASSYPLITASGGVTATPFTVAGVEGTLSATATQLTFTPSPAFVPVTGITGLPTSATVMQPLTLSGTVVPNTATNTTITWSVQNAGTTGANITGGNIFNSTGAGDAIMRATIVNGASPSSDYWTDFVVTVNKASQTAPAAPTLASTAYTSITLNSVMGCEYRRNDGAWQESNVFTGLTHSTSYVFTQRYAETATHFASPESPEATFVTDVNTGISEIADSQIKANPNPFTDVLQITGAEGCKLRVINIAGTVVYTLLISSPDETFHFQQLPAGIYFLQLEKNGTLKTIKIIKS